MLTFLFKNVDFLLFLQGLVYLLLGVDAIFLFFRFERRRPMHLFAFWAIANALSIWFAVGLIAFGQLALLLKILPFALLLGSAFLILFVHEAEASRAVARSVALTALGVLLLVLVSLLVAESQQRWILSAVSLALSEFLAVRALLVIGNEENDPGVQRGLRRAAMFLAAHLGVSLVTSIALSSWEFALHSPFQGGAFVASLAALLITQIGVQTGFGAASCALRKARLGFTPMSGLWVLCMAMGVVTMVGGGAGISSFLGTVAEESRAKYVEALTSVHKGHGVVPRMFSGTARPLLAVPNPDCPSGGVVFLPFLAEDLQGVMLPCHPETHVTLILLDFTRMLVVRSDAPTALEGISFLAFPLPEVGLYRCIGMIATVVGVLILVALMTLAHAMFLSRSAVSSAGELTNQYLANISHEIRTPINSIMGAIELLGCSELDARQRRHVSIARTSSEGLLQIVNDVVDFSRIGEGRFEMDVRDLELRAVVERVCDGLAKAASDKMLDLTWHVDGDVPELVRGDPIRLGQVLTNLVGNAVKYTDSGHVTISVARVSQERGSVRLRFMVKDSGIGIPQESLPRLFQRFSQVRFGNAIRVSGSGLGLAISRYLVERMRGEIGVESELAKGSTFWFTACFERNEEGPAWQSVLGRPMRDASVLVVDGSLAHGAMLVREARELGAAAEAVVSLQATHDLIVRRLRPLDVVLVDERLVQDELHLLQSEWSHASGLPHLRVVALTSLHRTEKSSEPQMPCLVKPVGYRQLKELWGAWREEGEIPLPSSVAVQQRERSLMQMLRVLVVEDNRVLQEVTASQLEMLGCFAEVVPDGERAIQTLSEREFDVVLMDVRMPGVDGMEATRRIRIEEQKTGRHQTIVAMTASALSGDRESCLQAGMDDYISKPVVLEELARVLIQRTRLPARSCGNPG